MTQDPFSTEVGQLVKQIKPLLAGLAPVVQGAALADLTAIWLCGYPPENRTEFLALQLKAIVELVQVNDHLIFGSEGHPFAQKTGDN